MTRPSCAQGAWKDGMLKAKRRETKTEREMDSRQRPPPWSLGAGGRWGDGGFPHGSLALPFFTHRGLLYRGQAPKSPLMDSHFRTWQSRITSASSNTHFLPPEQLASGTLFVQHPSSVNTQRFPDLLALFPACREPGMPLKTSSFRGRLAPAPSMCAHAGVERGLVLPMCLTN